jgi:hypothetical protein
LEDKSDPAGSVTVPTGEWLAQKILEQQVIAALTRELMN